MTQDWTLVVHGGAGIIEQGTLTPDQETTVRNALMCALAEGGNVLNGGGSALDAVV